MLIEKEVISPGEYWYIDQQTGVPRKWVVTADDTKRLHKDCNEMLSAGLSVPVPFEHDFQAHPMTPKEKLLNNAGEVKEYRLKGERLFSVVDIQDEDVKKKIGKSIRWTSPWITSFTDGTGRQWNNVIAHLALTTRPRVTKQQPFQSIAAALSMASDHVASPPSPEAKDGFFVSRAGRLITRKKDGRVSPQYPMAFSLWAGGIPLAEDDFSTAPPKKKKVDGSEGGKDDKDGKGGDAVKPKSPTDGDEEPGDYENYDDPPGEGDESEEEGLNPLADSGGDVKMEELLCDLLSTIGIQMPENCSDGEFKRCLYEALMKKVAEEIAKSGAAGDAAAGASGANTNSPAGNNPLAPGVQQEQQPMYMSLEDINKITDPVMKNIALSMYTENQKLRAEADADRKKLNSLNDNKLKEEDAKRKSRIMALGKVSPKIKADLEAMLVLPSMALAMGDGGAVVDPMEQTLVILEKGLSDLPTLLTLDHAALSVVPQPTDGDTLSTERVDEIANGLARQMGAPPERPAERKAS